MTLDIPLTNLSDAQLADAVEANLFALFRATATAFPGGELVENDDFSMHHTAFPNPMFNAVWRACLDEDRVDDAIAQAKAWFAERGAAGFHWWMTGQHQPAYLPERLQAHGFTPDYTASVCMGLDMETTPLDVPVPDDYVMIRVTTRAQLEEWHQVVVDAYNNALPPAIMETWVAATLDAGIADAPWQLYLGYLNGQPVATNMRFDGGGVSGLFVITTVPAARGKGIGGAMTLYPLLEARAQGYRYAVLFASKMGYPVYERVGFRDVGRTFGRYYWQKDSE